MTARFAGRCTPMVASAPMPISISPSPVITATLELRLRQREAEPDHRGAAHRAPEIEVAVLSRRARPCPRWPSRAPAPRTGPSAGSAISVAIAARRSSITSPTPCGRSASATAAPPPRGRRRTRAAAAFCTAGTTALGAIDLHAGVAQPQHRLDDCAHRHLPGIELGPFAAHRDEASATGSGRRGSATAC